MPEKGAASGLYLLSSLDEGEVELADEASGHRAAAVQPLDVQRWRSSVRP